MATKPFKRCQCPTPSKCDHSWVVRWWIDGGTKQREQSFKLNLDAARAFAKTVDAEHLASLKSYGSEPEPILFADYADGWLSRKKCTPNTRRVYEASLRLHLNPALGHRKLTDVAADREGVSSLLNCLSPGIQRPCYTTLSALMTEAGKAGRISTNRLHGIELDDPPPQKDLRFATHAEMVKLAEGLGPDLAPAAWIMHGCGLRPGEVLGLHKSDFEDGHLRLRRQQLRTGSSGPLKHRKADDYRDIPVPGYVREIVDELPDGPLFSVTTRQFNQRFRIAADAAGLTGYIPHDLRHVFASATLAAGVPISTVSMWLGHASIQTTFAVYGHLVPGSHDAAKAALDAAYATWSAASPAEGAAA